jgi:DNA-directed RNA polymerase subunit E'/Rpb7
MPRPAHTVEKVRLNLDMHPDVKAEIQAIQERLSADSMGEVIRRCVKAVTSVLEAHDRGDRVMVYPKDGSTPYEMLLFPPRRKDVPEGSDD